MTDANDQAFTPLAPVEVYNQLERLHKHISLHDQALSAIEDPLAVLVIRETQATLFSVIETLPGIPYTIVGGHTGELRDIAEIDTSFEREVRRIVRSGLEPRVMIAELVELYARRRGVDS